MSERERLEASYRRRAIRQNERDRDARGCALIVLCVAWAVFISGALIATGLWFLIHNLS